MLNIENYSIVKPELGALLDLQYFTIPPVGVWLLNENGGNLVFDEFNNNIGVLDSTASWTIDPVINGPAVSFNGTSGTGLYGILLPSKFNNILSVNSNWTHVLDFVRVGGTGVQTLLASGTGVSTDRTYIQISTTTVGSFIYYGSGFVGGSTPTNLNTKYRIITRNINKVVTVWVNGVKFTAAPSGSTNNVHSTSIGGGPFLGCTSRIGFFAVFNQPLSDCQIMQLFDSPYSGFQEVTYPKYFSSPSGTILNLSSQVISESSLSANQNIARVLAAQNLSNTSLLAETSVKKNLNSQANLQSEVQAEETVARKLSSYSLLNSFLAAFDSVSFPSLLTAIAWPIDKESPRDLPLFGRELDTEYWAGNPTICYLLNEQSGNFVYDVSKNKCLGTLNNGLSWFNSKLNFTTSTHQYISVADCPPIEFATSDFTLLITIQGNNTGQQSFFDKRLTSGAQTGYTIYATNTAILLQLNDLSAAHAYQANYSGLFNGKQNTLAVSISRTLNIANFYVNGNLISSNNISATVGSIASGVPLIIGASNTGFGGLNSALVSFIAAYPFVLSPSQIFELYEYPYEMVLQANRRLSIGAKSFLVNLSSRSLSESSLAANQLISRILAARGLTNSELFAPQLIKRNLNSQVILQSDNQSQEQIQRKLSSQVISQSFVRSIVNIGLAFASKVISASFAFGRTVFVGRKFQLLSFRRTSQQAIDQGGDVEDSGE